ncbi:fatty acid desaturase [Mycolicibacter sinensis]|jgi:fatty acid desaturase|uniref:fatty acid desaturase n=1 Tax=Mycolicibacter sinensis (strain JDM601) TaxID=875328 RepID=UPI0009ED9848|nr:fatty acid desaturase [Mycolicibacter sinensis]
MPPLDALDHASSKTVARQRHPHPGESIPEFAWPTLALGAGALIVFAFSTVAAIGGSAPVWLTISVNTAAVYAMFMVAHDALHHSVSSVSWVNSVIGRAAWLFVAPTFSLPAFSYVHLTHHRNANDGENDPDMFATHGPAWQLPFRWALMDVFYAVWYCRQLKRRVRLSWRRPLTEVAETAVMFSLSVAGVCVAVLTENFWLVATILLIPQRIGMVILGWWFDWLPHHGLEQTQQENRYRATRNRVGMEQVLIPVMLSQTYHLVHHLHPWLPFYRYAQAWRGNEDAYLAHDPAIATVFGRDLTPAEYREWKAGSLSAPGRSPSAAR